MGQAARQQITTKFRSQAPPRPGQSPKRVLVVYDALARTLGQDVHPVGLVINFDMPRAAEEYGPRISCVAQGQNAGPKPSVIISIVVPQEVDMIRSVESFFRIKINELPPNFAQV